MAEEEDDLDVPASGSGGMIKIAAGFVVGLLVGGGAGWFGNSALGPMLAGEDCEGEDCEAVADGEKEVSAERHVYDMTPGFTLNTRGSSTFVSLDLAVESTMDEETYTLHTARFRDQVVTLTSDYTPGELNDLDGRTRFKDELLQRFNTHLDDDTPRVERIYFKNFLVGQ